MVTTYGGFVGIGIPMMAATGTIVATSAPKPRRWWRDYAARGHNTAGWSLMKHQEALAFAAWILAALGTHLAVITLDGGF